MTHLWNRRSFLTSAATVAISGSTIYGNSKEKPEAKHVRATSGDDHSEPKWSKQLALTVGTASGDLVGKSDRVVQAAVDYVNRLGGGTVKLLPGTFTFRNAVHLPSKTRLQGSGHETVITRTASETIFLAADSDWYDQEITLEKQGNFTVGDGITLKSKPPGGSEIVIKRTLVAQSGNRFKLNKGLRKNLWVSGKPTCSSLFPLLTSENTSDVIIEDLTLDGNRANCTNLNGNYGGCVFLQDCNRYTIRNVTARNYNGDGFSFQICHDVVLESCNSHHNKDLGIHPGSGSQRPILRNNTVEHNGLGLFWCWGVKHGLAEGNTFDANGSYGMSIGHCDTDNIMRNNTITNSGKAGILFRDDNRGIDFWANRNLVENNTITNSGEADGVGIDIKGKTKDLRIINNVITENRQPMNRTGIRIGADVGAVRLTNNRIEGFQHLITDNRIEPTS